MKQSQISPPDAENIRATLAGKAAAILARNKAQAELSAKAGQKYDEESEAERLETTLDPEDAPGIARLAALKAKLPFYPTLLRRLEAAVATAERGVQESGGLFLAALVAGARETEARRKAALAKAIEPLEGPDFAEWASVRGPSVAAAANFVANPGATNLSDSELAQIICDGGIPGVTLPELPTAGFLAYAMQPAPQVHSASGRTGTVILPPSGHMVV